MCIFETSRCSFVVAAASFIVVVPTGIFFGASPEGISFGHLLGLGGAVQHPCFWDAGLAV